MIKGFKPAGAIGIECIKEQVNEDFRNEKKVPEWIAQIILMPKLLCHEGENRGYAYSKQE